MKRNHLIILILLLCFSPAVLKAQDDKTSFDKSRKISDQLKNGTAPGMKFAPASHKKSTLKEPTAAEKSVRVGQQLKNGSLPGTNVARGGGGSVSRPLNTNARRNNAGAAKLPSDAAAGSGIVISPATMQAPKVDQGGVKEVLTAPVITRKQAPAKPAADTDKKHQAGKQ